MSMKTGKHIVFGILAASGILPGGWTMQASAGGSPEASVTVKHCEATCGTIRVCSYRADDINRTIDYNTVTMSYGESKTVKCDDDKCDLVINPDDAGCFGSDHTHLDGYNGNYVWRKSSGYSCRCGTCGATAFELVSGTSCN